MGFRPSYFAEQFEKNGGGVGVPAMRRGYNERLSRINLYAPAHNKPFPFKSSQKANLSW